MQKIIALLLCSFLITSCAPFRTATPLPRNSEITVVSSLSNTIRYNEIGTTVFNNTTFDYSTPVLKPGFMIESAVVKYLTQQKGYRVHIKHVSDDTISSFKRNNEFSSAETVQKELINLTGTANSKRVLLLSDAQLYIYQLNTHDTVGVGYMNRSFFSMSNNIYFGAISFNSYDSDNSSNDVFRKIQLNDKADKNLFAASASQVTPASVQNLKQWLNTQFIPRILEDLQKAGI